MVPRPQGPARLNTLRAGCRRLERLVHLRRARPQAGAAPGGLGAAAAAAHLLAARHARRDLVAGRHQAARLARAPALGAAGPGQGLPGARAGRRRPDAADV